jgi:hypothetical protein
MAEVQEQFEQATQQPQPQKANWWYTLPEKDGLMVDLMTEDMNSYVAIEVYEDGNLVAQDEDSSMGMATVSY